MALMIYPQIASCVKSSRQTFAFRERYVVFRRDVTEHLKGETGTATNLKKEAYCKEFFTKMHCTITFDPVKKID